MKFNEVEVPDDGKPHVVTVITANGKTTTRVDDALEGPVNCPHVRGEFW